VGELHAVIHPDLSRISNSGYVVDLGTTRVYHPGDALTPPGGPVDVLFLPAHAPWSKIAEVADFGRTVDAPRSVAIHDGLLNDNGLGVVGRVLSGLLDKEGHVYERLVPGSDLSL
jgi:L-ascorbate metabolism protein UlaG (beta-lactamase superfamily)